MPDMTRRAMDAAPRAPRREGPGRYVKFVAEVRDVKLWEEALSGQIYLGDEAFVQRMQAYASSPDAVDIPRAQRRPVRQPLQWYIDHHDRDSAIVLAFNNGGYTQSAIALVTGLSVSRVSRLIKAAEEKGKT